MNNNISTITVSKFLTYYLGVNLDYSKKKMTHARVHEILRELGMDELVCDYHVEDEEIVNGEVLPVIDQFGKLKLYKNPTYLGFYPMFVDTTILRMELEKKKERLKVLRKRRINDLKLLSEFLDNITELTDEIQLLDEEIVLFEANEIMAKNERDSYNQKIKRKKKDKYGKHKGKRKFK